jgi:hypothetical protein
MHPDGGATTARVAATSAFEFSLRGGSLAKHQGEA